GTAYDESLGDQLRVTAIATGMSSVARRAEDRETRSAPLLMAGQQPVLRTGTDELPILTQRAMAGAAPMA
ncbi:MAG: cell division protein FtsZ, partial [Rubrivivax sp.]|nr:cell division protein FtsZ [Rubrivivax sp.]